MVDASPQALPVQGTGRIGTAWWGMLCLIATESLLFAFFLFSFLYLGTQATTGWPAGGPPSLALALPDTILLLLSSVVLQWGLWGVEKKRRWRWLGALGATILMGAGFIAVQAVEWSHKSFGLATSAYGSAYFSLTGLHMAHVAAGLIGLAVIFAWSLEGRFSPERHEHVSLAALYWHFVDAVWLAVFTTVYLVPRFT